MTQQLTVNGLKYIKGNEGCVLHPYEDQGGVPTIGYGMTHYPNGTPVTMNDEPITQAQADSYFPEEVQPYLQCVLDCCGINLNSNQLCALTDLTYNIGIGAFRLSNLRQHVNQNCVVEEDFTEYCHVNGKVDLGLLNRRKSEYNLFITNVPNQSINMETENTSTSAETVVEVKAEVQTLKVKSVTVIYDKTVNGEVTMSDQSATVNATPELIAALSLADSGLIEEGFNITVIA